MQSDFSKFFFQNCFWQITRNYMDWSEFMEFHRIQLDFFGGFLFQNCFWQIPRTYADWSEFIGDHRIQSDFLNFVFSKLFLTDSAYNYADCSDFTGFNRIFWSLFFENCFWQIPCNYVDSSEFIGIHRIPPDSIGLFEVCFFQIVPRNLYQYLEFFPCLNENSNICK